MLLLTESMTGTAAAAEADLLLGTDAGDVDHRERRRGVRIRQERPVKVFEHAAARYFGGCTRDVSATGLRLELPAWSPVQPGETLSIHVGLSTRGETLANRRQMIPVRVVWVKRKGGGQHTHIEAGVEYLASIAAHLDAA